MAFTPVPLISAREQWFQKTYACLPNGQFHNASQGMCILDNGEVWVYMARVDANFVAYPWDFGGASQLTEIHWIGKVSPEGCERVAGDEFVYGSAMADYGDAFGYRVPLDTDHYLPESAWSYTSESCFIATDGTYIYIYQNWGSTGAGSGEPYPRWSKLYRLDPQTYEFEWIAGSLFSSPTPEDNAIGLDATFGDMGQPVFHEGWMYFTDLYSRASPSFASPRMKLRRISLTAPYPVETVYTWAYTGYPGDTDSGLGAFMGAINPGTDLPNFFNEDALYHQHSNHNMMPMSYWDGYLYMLPQGYDSVPHQLFAIRRCPLAGGDIETLFYGIGWGDTIPPGAAQINRDNLIDSTEFPTGKLHDFIANHYPPSVIGTPELEGFDNDAWWIAVTPSGELMSFNFSGASYSGIIRGTRVCKFDLPDLIAHYEESGPWRVDRVNPQWDTIAGGTVFDETSLFRNTTGNRQREWLVRDGGTPLLSTPCTPGIATNNVHTDWVGKFAYLQSAPAESVVSQDYANNTLGTAMMVSVLDPAGGSGDLQVRLYFDGVALKGYGAVPGMEKAIAPAEVVLT